jgi:hypothetical protein
MEQQRPAAQGADAQEPTWRWKRDEPLARARNGVIRRRVVESIFKVWGLESEFDFFKGLGRYKLGLKIIH